MADRTCYKHVNMYGLLGNTNRLLHFLQETPVRKVSLLIAIRSLDNKHGRAGGRRHTPKTPVRTLVEVGHARGGESIGFAARTHSHSYSSLHLGRAMGVGEGRLPIWRAMCRLY